ncbi:tripartite tricarboxylate transporter TctB family protein [Ensifer soli]|uniref:tripartite tricarboxylate transporter TctB family protein n=1 Tax=Ciceribacter sp. sgz301302 TaxID=3342379 RepID=UPI0035B7C775
MSGPRPSARRPDGAALAIAAGLAAIAGLILYDRARLPAMANYSGLGPGSVPFVIACCLIGLAVWTVIAAFRNDFPARERQEIGPVVWVVAGLAGQMLLLKLAGFSIATGVLFACAAAGFGRKRLLFTLPVGIALSFAIWLVFSQLLQLSLPAGPLERLIAG